MTTTFETANAEFEAACRDAAREYGDEYLDECVPDLLESLATTWPLEVAREMCRTQLGFIPARFQVCNPSPFRPQPLWRWER